MVNPNSRGGEIDSTSGWEEVVNTVAMLLNRSQYLSVTVLPISFVAESQAGRYCQTVFQSSCAISTPISMSEFGFLHTFAKTGCFRRPLYFVKILF